MSRSEDLEAHICEANDLVRQLEDLLRESDDPKRDARLRREIDRQKGFIEEYRQEYLGLRAPGEIPEDVREILGISPQQGEARGGIFLSYRREDSAGHTGRLYDRLAERFPERPLFLDVEALEPGRDWVAGLEGALERSVLMVAVIGPRWLQVSGPEGEPRLGRSDDPLRREIAAALQSRIPVLPVLVGGARMPAALDLPPDLQPLARRQALEIRDDAFAEGVGRLFEHVQRLVPPGR